MNGVWRQSPDGQCKSKKCKCKCHKEDGYEYRDVPLSDDVICPWCGDDSDIEQEDVGSEEMDTIIVLRCGNCQCQFDPPNEIHEEGDEELKAPTTRQRKGY